MSRVVGKAVCKKPFSWHTMGQAGDEYLVPVKIRDEFEIGKGWFGYKIYCVRGISTINTFPESYHKNFNLILDEYIK